MRLTEQLFVARLAVSPNGEQSSIELCRIDYDTFCSAGVLGLLVGDNNLLALHSPLEIREIR
jgi:hypothetical protein